MQRENNQVTKVKVGTKVIVDNQGRQRTVPDTISIYNAGKTEEQIASLALLVETLSQTSGSGDTKNKVASGVLKMKPGVVLSVKDFKNGFTEDVKVEFLEAKRKYENGFYSLVNGTKLEKSQNGVFAGIKISYCDITQDADGNDVYGVWKTEFNTADMTGMMNSSILVDQDGDEMVNYPISQLVSRTYSDLNYYPFSKRIVIEEEKPFQMRLHVAKGVWRPNIAIKLELVGSITY